MIKNKEELKNYNIICINDKEIKECFNLLEKLGFEIDKRLLANFSVFINFNNTQNLFLNAKKLESNYDKNITFYEFKKLAKKFLKEKKLEDFEVASDGRITKINNWNCNARVYAMNGISCEIEETDNNESNNLIINLGLLYATEEARDKAIFKLEIETKLKNIAERLNGKEKIDWDNHNQKKFFIFYDYDNDNVIYEDYNCILNHQGAIYCLSENFLDEVIQEIGKENLIKYFKGE